MKRCSAARVAAWCAFAFTFAGCSIGSQSSLPYMQSGAALRALNATGAGKITHVVYIVQENRSFDNMFQGYPGADTVSQRQKFARPNDHATAVQLSDVVRHRPLGAGDVRGVQRNRQAAGNELPDERIQQRRSVRRSGQSASTSTCRTDESKPYFDMAHEWVVADRMFQSQLDESFVAHQYVIAAQAAWSVDLPVGAMGLRRRSGTIPSRRSRQTATRTARSIKPCYDYQTLGDELDKAKLSWRFYASSYGSASSDDGAEWSSYQAVRHIRYGPDWKKDVISPNWKFITDVRAGKLANFTWITPVCDDSDHVNCPGGYGPSWVSALVNTVGKSKFWDSTVIFVQWDDWGGLYDHVPPPYKDRDSLGFRVPLLVISPYAKHELRLARAVRNGERAALCRRPLRPRSARRGRQARDLARGRLFRLLAEAASVREDRGAATAEVLHAPISRRLLRARLRISAQGVSGFVPSSGLMPAFFSAACSGPSELT